MSYTLKLLQFTYTIINYRIDILNILIKNIL